MFGKKKRLAKLAAEQAAAEAKERELAEEELKKAQALEDAKAVGEEKIFVESELCDDDDDFDSTKEYEAIAYILKEEEGEAWHAESLDDQMPIPEVQSQPIDLEEELPEQPLPLVEEVAEPELEEIKEVAQDAQQAEDVQPKEEVQPEEAVKTVDDAQQAPQPAENVQESVKEAEPVKDEVKETTPSDVHETSEDAQEEVVYVIEGEEEDDEIVKPAKLVKLPNLIDYMLMQNMTKRMKLNIATLLLSAYQKYKDIPQEKKIIVKCMAKVMASLIQPTTNK